MHIPRLIISGLSGGAGKTMLSLGLARAFARSGLRIKAFKKGPDYIDAAWLALAARAPKGNLDPFFTPQDALRRIFLSGVAGYRLALVEGNRGLFDGLDISGSCSTAEVARILQAPVLLILDCTKMTRTAAALVKGCLSFEPDLHLGGVILNRTGNERHQTLARRAVEELAGVPVLGILPRRAEPFIMERHMGLVGMEELGQVNARLDLLADFIESHTDLARILELTASAPDLPQEEKPLPEAFTDSLSGSPTSPQSAVFSAKPESRTSSLKQDGCLPASRMKKPHIGYVHDAALWFYYQENLQALKNAGAKLVPLSLLNKKPWPEIAGLYLGGGLPELYARQLCDNHGIRTHVARLAADKLPIYAECGGFMYLAKELIIDDRAFAMAGVFSCSIQFHPRPKGLGYVEGFVSAANPFHPTGLCFRGHEFHFSALAAPLEQTQTPCENAVTVLTLHKGNGIGKGPGNAACDGLLKNNTFAAYTHIYAPSLPHWAPAFVSLCRQAL